MLRSIFISLSKADWARRIIMNWGFARRMATRFVAGETIPDAIRAVAALNSKGINATLDHLGEHTTTAAEAQKSAQDVIELLDAIQSSGVRSNVSIKLSQIGLALDKELCRDQLVKILEYAQKHANFIRVDMEDATTVDATLELYDYVRRERGLTNVGLVIQSYLYRSEADILRLRETATPVRLCKGAYKEASEVAFPEKADVDRNFDHITDLLFETSAAHGKPTISENGLFPPIPAIATHDEKRINYAIQAAEKYDLPKPAYEFQMLNGIRRDLQEKLAADGYPVRVYVPYGTQWYPYFMRRLAERPANIWFFASNYFRG